MGKVRRQRKKLHLEAKPKNPDRTATNATEAPLATGTVPTFELKPEENLFAGLNIDITSLNKNLSDDVRSVKSYKSVKSECGKVLSKKDKLMMRREMLMKKFEVMAQQKQLSKKKKKDIVGDMNPLRDALPSLESLLKNRGNVTYSQKVQSKKKKKGIEKLKKQKKNHLQGVKMFQQILKNKYFQKDPQLAISQHLQTVFDQKKSS